MPKIARLARANGAGSGTSVGGGSAAAKAIRKSSTAISSLVPRFFNVNRVNGAGAGQTMVLATLFDPTHVRALDPHALAAVFGLTPAESRVAALLALGGTAADVATSLGVSESTIRTHVRNVLAKLGVASKTELVRLLGHSGWMWRKPHSAGLHGSWCG